MGGARPPRPWRQELQPPWRTGAQPAGPGPGLRVRLAAADWTLDRLTENEHTSFKDVTPGRTLGSYKFVVIA